MTKIPASMPHATAVSATAVVPSDVIVLRATHALYVGVSGDVAVLFANDATPVTLKSMPVGKHDIRVVKVLATGTTATNIVALF